MVVVGLVPGDRGHCAQRWSPNAQPKERFSSENWSLDRDPPVMLRRQLHLVAKTRSALAIPAASAVNAGEATRPVSNIAACKAT